MSTRSAIALCLLLAAVMGGIGLGTNDFWDDEANTALIGRNFMRTGIPSGWDGHNLASYGMRGSLDADMRKTVPPLQYLLAGISLKLFGDTTAGGRLLFLGFGLGALLFAALWYRAETGNDNLWTVALVLALSVSFLLYIRQVRYYAPGLFFTFAFLWSWARLKQAETFRPHGFLAVIFLILLVLTHYLHAAAALAVAAAGFIKTEYRNRRSLVLFGALVGVGLLGLGWAAAYSPAILKAAFAPETGALFRLTKTVTILQRAPLDVLWFEFFPAGALLFGLPAVWALRSRALPYLRQTGVLLLYCAAVMVAVALLSPQPDGPYNLSMRFCIAVIPLAAAIMAVMAAMLQAAKMRKMVWIFLGVLLSSNLLTIPAITGQGLHSRIGQYLHENIVGYTTGSEAIGDYIRAHIPRESCLFMVPTHTALIQMFYHPEHTFCGMVSVHSTVARHNRDALRESLFFETTVPDYFIIMRLMETESRRLLDMVYGQGAYALKDTLYVYGENLTRPEIPWRSFGPMEPKFPGEYQVFVFARTDAPAHVPAVSAELFENYIAF